jgi:hypothetical protein
LTGITCLFKPAVLERIDKDAREPIEYVSGDNVPGSRVEGAKIGLQRFS